jgi:glycosyltransferase involved in cell wall biosynthesis
MAPARRRLRIVFMIDFVSSTGGAERFAVGLATHLPRDRFEPWICSTRSADPAAAQALADAGVPHINLGRRTKWDMHRLAGMAALLRRERFDILHTHKFGSNIWGALIGWSCRVPAIVAHEHSWEYEGDPLRAWLDGRVIGRIATRFVAVSSADAKRMVSYEHVPEEKVVVIPNGYIPSPSESETDVRRELGLAAGTPLIAIAALLRAEKRLDLLLEAHARVVAVLGEAHLAIAGDGDGLSALQHQADRLGLRGCVHFLGRRDDVDSILRAADVAAITSDREGSPLLVFECMATGTPLVATNVGGIPDVVQDGTTGILVPRRDPAAFADALVSVLSDPARRAAMGAAAAAQLKDFTIDAIASRFADMYETIAA